ncbi:Acetolactate synthase large subunit biosynthetic [Penicillium nucicola]|uniref:Acetolactate synthase large subunit biosynthetic n=1 Tax=Penicillium nucicola TaxID=1850975 RepID=UPI002545B353|nr:Acetolactate synthase large subunit biosynthetic [Penicillium nucicola]KAJ5749317.1 Acetolactate synthase large subunit biosynthetic [Penicillium nucicola]
MPDLQMKPDCPKGLTGGELLCELLGSHNVDHVFGYPGGAALPLFDGVYKTNLFQFILSHHEQGAGHMAEGYASASMKPGVVLVTSGPGSSNLVTPLLNALLDGTPMVAICGQVATTVQGTGAFQEIDVVPLARTCTKWCSSVKSVRDLPDIINEAFHQATSARPGPVLVSIPKDIGKEVLDPISLGYPLTPPGEDTPSGLMSMTTIPRAMLPGLACDIESVKPQVSQVAALVNHSQRPIICAGHGVLASKDGSALLSQIAKTYRIPVVTTLLGLGSFDEDHELALHMIGTYGAPYANYALQSADLILVFGARLEERAVGSPAGYAPKAREAAQTGQGGIIQFDNNAESVAKVVKPTQPILGDLSVTLRLLLSRLEKRDDNDIWLDQIKAWKKQYAFRTPQIDSASLCSPQRVIAEVDRQTAPIKHRTILTTGVGQHQMWTAQRYRFRHPHSFVTSGALGTMGFGVPAAIGAQVAQPNHTVIDIDGDASFCMTMEELLTAAQYNIPIKVIVLNNNTQGMIAQLQRADYEGRICYNRQRNPHFVQLAESMGCGGRQCSDSGELSDCITWLLEYQGPALLEVLVQEAEMLPIVPNGKALDLIKLESGSVETSLA